jgi:hypothetical protein
MKRNIGDAYNRTKNNQNQVSPAHIGRVFLPSIADFEKAWVKNS